MMIPFASTLGIIGSVELPTIQWWMSGTRCDKSQQATSMYNTIFDTVKLQRYHLTNHNAVGDRNLALVRNMESLTLDAGQFNHRAHVELAWTYLKLHPPQQALDECVSAIKKFATHHGAAGKYHATITLANFLIVANSMEEADNTETWPSFVRRNNDLLMHPMESVYKLYTHERLNSDEARTHFLEPDGKQRL